MGIGLFQRSAGDAIGGIEGSLSGPFVDSLPFDHGLPGAPGSRVEVVEQPSLVTFDGEVVVRFAVTAIPPESTP